MNALTVSVTHWRDEAAYGAWSAARTQRTASVGDSHELWAFDVSQSSTPA